MAEERTETQTSAGRANEPGTSGPETSQASSQAGASAPQTPQTPDYSARIAALEQLNERYKQQLDGSAAEARRLKQQYEQIETAHRQTQDQLRGIGMALSGQTPDQVDLPRTPADAFRRAIGGDEAAFDAYFAQQNQGIGTIVDQRLMQALGILQRQQLPSQLHPELNEPTSRKEILTAYDEMAANPAVQMLFPQDQTMLVPMAGPDGQQRNYDLRLLDRAALQAKTSLARLQAAKEEKERLGAGDAMSGGGGKSGGAEIEPVELFTERELSQFVDASVLKALPTEAGKDAKSIAKWLVEKMLPAEKEKRTQQWRSRKMAERV